MVWGGGSGTTWPRHGILGVFVLWSLRKLSQNKKNKMLQINSTVNGLLVVGLGVAGGSKAEGLDFGLCFFWCFW